MKENLNDINVAILTSLEQRSLTKLQENEMKTGRIKTLSNTSVAAPHWIKVFTAAG
jgi:hypothetical protein